MATYELNEEYNNKLQPILEARYTVDRLYTEELIYIYPILYPEDEKRFDEYLSLADYKRKVKIIAEKIGLEFIDFQEQPRKNFQIPYLYGLIICSYFIKMAHDKYMKETKEADENANNFFNNVSKGDFENISADDIIDFYEIFSYTLKIGIFSKAFKRKYSNMKFSQNKQFNGLLIMENLDLHYASFIEDNILYIQNSHRSTFYFKRDIIMIKQNFLEDISHKFNSIIDKLTEKNTLNSLIMFSAENSLYQDLVVNKDKRSIIENSRLQEALKYSVLSSLSPIPIPDFDIVDDIDSIFFTEPEFEDIGAQLPLEDKAVLSALLKIKISSYISSKSDLPIQVVSSFYQKILNGISDIDKDFQYFCRKSLELIDSYIYSGDIPPTGLELIEEVYKDLASEKHDADNKTIMLSPLTQKERKTLLAHFS
ncbi:hypothetical protein LNN31_16465 [Acetobacterium wieringae]|uniref:TerB-C domain-containing protein n=1 Tax=Acetobacterium wieringae TaxID=52694 RepID=A0ABY6HCY2_9FIRM|nr:hypothetical protein [Acetobacterium wieringae]UYO62363.1 hypothetical protein LNN31_16465 [Acetobacterium wieringae]VUZ22985.1 Uncharacterised protein [Acetobacterium wieringae]